MQQLTWHVSDSLTGRIIGQLQPETFEIIEPLRSPSTGTLVVALPNDTASKDRLRNLLQPHNRAISLVDEQGRYITAGPIPRKASLGGDGRITVPYVDWRSWFYSAALRPTSAGVWRDYIKIGASAREQISIVTDLMKLALEVATAITPPYLVVDVPPASGITREMTARMLANSIGESLDDIMNRERGCEWWTYASTSADPAVILWHVTAAWPERRGSAVPHRLEWRVPQGGNTYDVTWPEGDDFASRVWGIGDGEPPAQPFTSVQREEIGDGLEVSWETVLGPLENTPTRAGVFEKVYAELQRERGNTGTAEFSILADVLPFGDVSVGDRARVVFDNGWDQVDIPAARITQRVLSGGTGKAAQQRLSVDLSDGEYADDGTDPGEQVTDDG